MNYEHRSTTEASSFPRIRGGERCIGYVEGFGSDAVRSNLWGRPSGRPRFIGVQALMSAIAITVNGQWHQVDVAPDTPLLWVLRDTLGFTGTKYGCGMGLCGACTVHVDGQAQRSCQTPIGSVRAKHVTTIEGLSVDGDHPVQRAWVAEQVPQCGYCQSGQIMQAAALLATTPHPTPAQIDEAMNGNICRCGTYQRIRRAIQRAAEQAA